MSSAGRAASLSGCVGRPRGHETGLTATPSKSNTLRPLAALSWKRPNIGSRMNREVHVRIWERPEVRVLRATRRPTRVGRNAIARIMPLANGDRCISGGTQGLGDRRRVERNVAKIAGKARIVLGEPPGR